jgi:hypothetical protein
MECVLTTEETEILQYLKSFRGDYVSAKEISRRAGTKKRYREEPNWARPFLSWLVNKELIETDDMGRYRFRSERKDIKNKRKWVSPQIAKILEKSGRTFEVLEGEGGDLPRR